MTKEQLALKIAREIYRGKGRLESFHALQCIRSYFSDLSMDDLEGIEAQYGINIQKNRRRQMLLKLQERDLKNRESTTTVY